MEATVVHIQHPPSAGHLPLGLTSFGVRLKLVKQITELRPFCKVVSLDNLTCNESVEIRTALGVAKLGLGDS